jgi:hypothetical protein
MKTSALTLLLLFMLSAIWPKQIAAHSGTTPTVTACWPADSTVRVYFVRGLFTSEQTETLWKTLEEWGQKANSRGSTVRFVNAGQASGLIDCMGCLTISRQEVYGNKSRRVSFNRLRYDQAGQLISAWIGVDRAVTDSPKLQTLMLQTLERELSILAAETRTTWTFAKDSVGMNRKKGIETP